MWIVQELLYLKVTVIFAMQPVHLYGENLFLVYCSVRRSHVKLQCHYASLGKYYRLNEWIVLALLYSKVTAILALPCMLYSLNFLNHKRNFSKLNVFYLAKTKTITKRKLLKL